MNNYKLTIEYDGTNLSGWQIQKKGERTAQGEIKKVCEKIFNNKVTVIGSGRTDSGVHALGQVANFKTSTRLKPAEIKRALNANLPKDISIRNVIKVGTKFHAQYSAKSKTYRYTILNREEKSALDRNVCLHCPYPLNLTAMRTEAKCLIGKHDFKSFQAADSKRSGQDTVRTIKNISIKKQGDYIIIDVTGNGFLYKMVRNIVGTLIKVGRGFLPKGSIKEILSGCDRALAGDTAKASGLCLMQVTY